MGMKGTALRIIVNGLITVLSGDGWQTCCVTVLYTHVTFYVIYIAIEKKSISGLLCSSHRHHPRCKSSTLCPTCPHSIALRPVVARSTSWFLLLASYLVTGAHHGRTASSQEPRLGHETAYFKSSLYYNPAAGSSCTSVSCFANSHDNKACRIRFLENE